METKRVEALVSVGARYVGRAPAFEVGPPWWSEVEEVNRRLDELLGVRTVVLRLVHADEAEIGRGGRTVYHVQAMGEPRSGVLDETPYDGWDAIVAPHPLRSTWAEVDGPERIVEWARSFLGPVEPVQVKTWNLSCLLRVPGAWAKATSRFASVDADIIEHVQRYDETLAPTVLGKSVENRWSLLAHAPGNDCWEPDRATVENVVSRWVAVQAQLATEVDELSTPSLLPGELTAEANGLTAPRLLRGELAAEVDGLTAPRLLPGELTAEVERLLSVVPLSSQLRSDVEHLLSKLPSIVAELDTAGLPITLVHGDFHPGNWRSDGTARAIVDWADTFIGHPATDIQRLIGWLPAAKRAHALDVWTTAWKNHVPAADPERALPPTAILVRLLYAVMYQRFLDNIEPAERIYHEDDPASELQAAVEAYGLRERGVAG
ncbi:phosphotransferase [Kribbella steppae]|uniref:phosphotransferase n=1 Tax=Kribbella steppae TaxID=2512223 RepID=UPI001052FAC7|nr:phosphotransferase [Kribbella steppae]